MAIDELLFALQAQEIREKAEKLGGVLLTEDQKLDSLLREASPDEAEWHGYTVCRDWWPKGIQDYAVGRTEEQAWRLTSCKKHLSYRNVSSCCPGGSAR